MSRAAAEVGSTANSYQILAKLASGGMAEIFLARGEGVAGVERYCVLKRILRDRATDVHFVQMFLDEARLAAQLQHPNIAQVHDIGKLGDSYFFTMEYVHGETVRALLHRALGLRRKLPIGCVLTIVAGAAAGLHHAHVRVGVDGRALGIVHRDVSPSNLMVSYEGSVKLVDFGVAKAADRAHETKSGTVKGKISYLSPEQCRGKRVDRRSDLFSLGICFWEMLTTERLYRRASDFENMNAIVSEPPPSPSSRRADVPAELDALVMRLLAKDPDDRCQTAEEVVEAVEAIATRTGSVLSASALGRFVRELFGQRPEPWLELESLQEHGEAITVTSEPIPQELAIPPADRIDHQLASVLDLSAPRQITESLDPVLDPVQLPSEVPTAQLGKPAKRGFPLAAPPPTHPGISVVPAPESQSTAPRPTGPSPAVPAPIADSFNQSSGIALPAPPTAPELPAPAGPGPSPSASVTGMPAAVPTSASASFAAVPPASTSASLAAVPPASTSASFAAVPPASTSASFAKVPASISASLPAAAVPAGAASGSLVAPAAPPGVATPHGAGPRRAGWPLYAVIAGAAVVGSVAMVLLMRSGGDRGGAIATGPRSVAAPAGATAPPERARDRITVEPIEPEASARPVAPAPAAEAGGPGAPIASPKGPDAIEPVEPGPSAAAPRTGSGGGSPRSGSSPRPGSVAVAKGAAPRAPHGGPAAVPHAPDPRDHLGEDTARLYSDGHYDQVVAQCGKGQVSAERAPLCFLAACHAGDEAAARRLIAVVPAPRRDQLTTNCKQLGVDVRRTDCEADPMSCQH